MLEKFETNKEDIFILVIDIQERLIKAMEEGPSLITNVQKLLMGATILDIPVMVTEQYPKGLGSAIPAITDCLKNTTPISKMTFSACAPQVLEVLKTQNVKNIVIVGMETHVCVFQTARQLLKEGYDVFLAADGICSRNKELKENGLNLIENMGAVITNVETLLFNWLEVAGTDSFKAISKIVK
ncbi:hypothetical protein AZF37_02735 [endosymbiont 'TC1' of Trimyema compressum]|uniref:isochorismatase family protein n=1 Tax=endosymbiont 'TC1' of Trimyema compressum TaxID=243899 RepID=UPI0007F0B427|nr:isochorismatase family protein [endosymbiont 'TC1' of Trimyema compressum]AMP20232.1 hypothetical protein AZF37_02735 [endosymbiont 'TC1' of Trimyema compressum]